MPANLSQALRGPQSDSSDAASSAVLRRAPVPMAIVDGPDWRFAFANDAWLALIDQQQLCGRTIAESLPLPVAQHLAPLLERTRSSGLACIVDEFGMLSGGDERRETFCRLMLHPLAHPDRAAAILIVGVDVTGYVRARQAAVDALERVQMAEANRTAFIEGDRSRGLQKHFRSLFESLPGLYVVLTPREYEIVAVSDAYLQATMKERFELVGRRLFDVFPPDPSDPDDEARRNLKQSLSRVESERRVDVMAVQRYPLRQPKQAGGMVEDRYWSPVNAPVLGPAGQVTFIIHRVEDVTAVASKGGVTRSPDEDWRIAMQAELVHRAQDLQRANQQLRLNEERLQAEIEERTRAEDARKQLLHRLVDAQEQERRRIARELHDTLGQHLTALDVGLKTLGDLEGCPSPVTGSLDRLRGLAARIGDEVDRLAYELRPQVLDDLGLASAIGHYVDEWSRDTGIATDVHLYGLEDRRLSEALETTVFRVVQEALTNVRRHAAASSANVVVECRGGELLAIVEDRGCGFSPERPASDARRGLGLVGMRERATLVGGIFEIETRPGHGTTIYLRVPLS
jgi:signal transduction histidine kinase